LAGRFALLVDAPNSLVGFFHVCHETGRVEQGFAQAVLGKLVFQRP